MRSACILDSWARTGWIGATQVHGPGPQVTWFDL